MTVQNPRDVSFEPPRRIDAEPDQALDDAEVWDVFAPASDTSLFGVIDGAAVKVAGGQTRRVSISLERSPFSESAVRNYFNTVPAIDNGERLLTWREAFEQGVFGTVDSQSGARVLEVSILDAGVRDAGRNVPLWEIVG